ncbi:MAG: ABC transporter permease [Nitrospirae bacterium]|nr:ABC transporter permease [Nitrospirota bacterium]
MLRIYLQRFVRIRSGLVGAVLLVALGVVGLAAPVFEPRDPDAQALAERLRPPSASAWMGTDELGRDVLSRMLRGARISLSVGFVAVGISVVIGTGVGVVSGFLGGWVDAVLMRLVDIMLCFPTFFLILMVLSLLEPGIFKIMAVIGLTSWPGLARVVRAECLKLRELEFVTSARALGVTRRAIMARHVFPNVLSYVMVAATLGVGGAILTEAGLSFLGLGVQPPTASWGNILTSGKDYIHVAWWLMAFPGLAILATVLAFNLVGEALRDAIDPRQAN